MINKRMAAAVLLFLLPVSAGGQIIFGIGGGTNDYGMDIGIDRQGDIIVAGAFSGTVDFDAGPGVTLLSSEGLSDNFVAKYDGSGILLWAISFGGALDDAARSVAIDSTDNIYVCGFFKSPMDFDPGTGVSVKTPVGMEDGYVAKFNSSGEFIWVNTFGSDSIDQAYDVAANRNGDLFVAGSFQHVLDADPGDSTVLARSSGKKDIILLKYDTDGNYLWHYSIGTEEDDEALGVACDPLGNPYITGTTTKIQVEPNGIAYLENQSPKSNTNVFLSRLSSKGSRRWYYQFDGPKFDSPSIGGISIGSIGQVVITGVFSDTVDFNPGDGLAQLINRGDLDIFVSSYDTSGYFMSCFGVGGTSQDRGAGVSVDRNGFAYVTGSFKGAVDFDPGPGANILFSNGTSGAGDIFIAKYNLQGGLFWAIGIGPSLSNPASVSSGLSLKADNSDNFYITGNYYGDCDFNPLGDSVGLSSGGSSDIFIGKYNRFGKLWMNLPEIYLDQDSLNFASVKLNSIKKIILDVTNIGDGDLVVSNISSTNPAYTPIPNGMSLVPSASDQIEVAFFPTHLGDYPGYLIIESNAKGGIDSIPIVGVGGGTIVSRPLDILPTWNLFSIPVILDEMLKENLFPGAVSEAFAYPGGGYQAVGMLTVSIGYWLKFDSLQTISFTGAAVDTLTINVKSGWNLIGSLSYPVTVGSIAQDPEGVIGSGYYGFDGAYFEATELVPGRGYWVKATQNGKITLSASGK